MFSVPYAMKDRFMDTSTLAGGQQLVLSSLAPSRGHLRLASSVILALAVGFVIVAGPSATMPLKRIDAFIPAYGTAIFVNDCITSALLFAQFSILRSVALLALGSGYLLTGLVAVPWTLTFPGVFGSTGTIGAGLQSTVWLYVFWHVGFATFVIAYSLLKDRGRTETLPRRWIGPAILIAAGAIVALVCAVTILVTAGGSLLPRLMLDTVRISPRWLYFAIPTIGLIVVALILLWLRRRSVLDLWLMVVMCAYAIEIALISFPVPARFSLGWYAGRIYGLLAGSLVLLMLVEEITLLYAGLVSALVAQRRERDARLLTGDAISASIAHEVRQPLSAITTNGGAALRWLDRPEPEMDEVRAALTRIVADGNRAAAIIENVRALFRNETRALASIPVNDLIQDALALVRGELTAHRVNVHFMPDNGVPRIYGDRLQLQQVLVNLMTNAIDAMAHTAGDRVLRISCEATEPANVIVSVEDTGHGVDAALVDRIFDPLFTTKAHGMGMGLSICRSILDAHGGRLWVTRKVPCGAAFHFAVPVDPVEPSR
jgi:signal transduction histidine kinase